jgi:hypothetical protein
MEGGQHLRNHLLQRRTRNNTQILLEAPEKNAPSPSRTDEGAPDRRAFSCRFEVMCLL